MSGSLQKFLGGILMVWVACATAQVVDDPSTDNGRMQDLDRVLVNNQLMKYILKCILLEGPCDKRGNFMKMLAPQLLAQVCPDCPPIEDLVIRRIFNYLQRYYPVEWTKMLHIYPPPTTFKPYWSFK